MEYLVSGKPAVVRLLYSYLALKQIQAFHYIENAVYCMVGVILQEMFIPL